MIIKLSRARYLYLTERHRKGSIIRSPAFQADALTPMIPPHTRKATVKDADTPLEACFNDHGFLLLTSYYAYRADDVRDVPELYSQYQRNIE